MDLYLIPLAFTLLAALAPANLVRYVGLTGALVSLISVGIHAAYYVSGSTVVLFEPGQMTTFGLTFKMGYDGISLYER